MKQSGARLRGLKYQSAQADFVPFQPANSFAGILPAHI
jgi:hypothetical protein